MTDHPPIFDAHCHIFPAKIAAKATGSIGGFYDSPMAELGAPEVLLAEMDRAGIAQALVCSTATKPEQVTAINDFIHGAVQAAPDRLYGFGTLQQDLPEQTMLAEIDRIGALGLHGVKLHPDFQKRYIDDPRMLPAYRYLAEKHLPVLFHVGDRRYDFSAPERLARVAQAVPDLLCMAAHLGGYQIWERCTVLAGLPNVIFDCSSSLEYLPPETARRYMNRLGWDRILFGSDFPMWRPADAVALVRDLKLDSAKEEAVFSDNFRRWLKSEE